MDNKKENQTITKEQIISLTNRKELTISGTNKIISIKSDIIQLDTNYGGLIINGENLELKKLDNNTSIAEINGNINSLKFIETKEKTSLFRKIFK